jgi:hypothetical protein
VVLRRPVRVGLPVAGAGSGDEPVAAVRFYADDPKALIAAAGEHVPAAQ